MRLSVGWCPNSYAHIRLRYLSDAAKALISTFPAFAPVSLIFPSPFGGPLCFPFPSTSFRIHFSSRRSLFVSSRWLRASPQRSFLWTNCALPVACISLSFLRHRWALFSDGRFINSIVYFILFAWLAVNWVHCFRELAYFRSLCAFVRHPLAAFAMFLFYRWEQRSSDHSLFRRRSFSRACC